MASISKFKFATASGTGPDLASVFERALGVLMDRLDATADIVFVFFSSQYVSQLDDRFFKIAELLATDHVFGCSAESIICDRTEFEMEPAVSLWAARMPGVEILPMHLTFDARTDGGAFLGWPDGIRGDWSKNSFLIGLADPFSFPMDVFLQRMNTDRPGTKIMGGMSSGGSAPRDCQLIIGDRLYDNGCVMVRFQGDIRLRTVVSQGCRPIGRPLVITRSERNLIFELGGVPALKQLQQLFEDLPERDQMLMHKGLHIGRVVNELLEDVSQGDFLVRNVIGIDESSNGLVVADYVRPGQTIQFHLRDGDSAHIELQRMLSEQARLGKHDIAGALSFSCNGRGTHLFDLPHHDARLIQDFLGPIPLAGFFAAGEIGPVAKNNFLHGFTNSIALFEKYDSKES